MRRFSSITIFIILVICLGFTVKTRWIGKDGDAWKQTIASDGYGYYAYLPCIFIYHKFDYKRLLREEQKYNAGAYCGTDIVFQNKEIDKYFPGVALLLAPFFLIAYLLSYLLGYGTGGYEFFFQASVSIGALFYLATGLIFLRKLMKEFGISDFIMGLTLILVVFGTNLFHYATMSSSMSHVYSFGITAVFLFYTKKSIDDTRLKNLLWMTVTISILVLIRPTNLLSLALIPFLAGNWKATSAFILSFFKSKKVFVLSFIVMGILSIDFFVWHWQTGHFFVWSYAGEGFDFKNPHFLDILFSYRKGWFVYTPLMFVATLGGLITFYRKNRFRFFTFLVFFLVVTYILSSWWSWWYGGSFGLRAYIDFYPVFALLLALFLNSLTSLWLKIPVLVLVFLCLFLNLFQNYQSLSFILPYDGMNKEKYWRIFLKDNNSYVGIFNYPDTSGYNFLSQYTFTNNFEHNTWGNDQNITTAYAHSGTHSAFVNEQYPYSPTFTLNVSALPQAKSLNVFVKLWEYMPGFDNNAVIVASLQTKNGEGYFWESKTLQGYVFERNVWSRGYALFGLPTLKNPSDELRVYVLNTEGIVYVDDIDVTFGIPK